jgi:hypothetical protein
MLTTSPIKLSLFPLLLVAAMTGSLILCSQEPSSQLSPRELFYREQASGIHQMPSAAPAKGRAAAQATAISQKTPSSAAAPSGPTEEGSGKNATLAPVETSTATKTNPEVPHLGLRYSLLLVDKTTGETKPVSSNQVFDQGECFSFEFQSNRSGYLYVFNLGSSGTWKPLLPTAEMPEEGNFAPAFTTMRVPSSHCFRIAGPPGGEHLFVVLSRNPQDVNELNQSIRNGRGGGTEQSHPDEAGGGMMATASSLTQAVQKIASLKGRDLEVQEVGGIKNGDEPTPAVYIVHTSATPADKVMTEIQITHR